MAMFDEEVKNLKNKLLGAQDRYNQAYVELELVKNNFKMQQQECSRLETKIQSFTQKIEEKNQEIKAIRSIHSKNEKETIKGIEDKKNELEGKLKENQLVIRGLQN